jgi:hypothetical protein
MTAHRRSRASLMAGAALLLALLAPSLPAAATGPNVDSDVKAEFDACAAKFRSVGLGGCWTGSARRSTSSPWTR